MAQSIQYIVEGDLLHAQEQVIVNPVNCRGVMGAGLALTFKQRYPKMFRAYQQQCESGELRIGQPQLYTGSQPWILNFPTKDHYRQPSRLIYIQQGLDYLIANWQQEGIESIAFPKLGCGKGGLSWDEVGPLMAQSLGSLSIPTTIYIDKGDREYQRHISVEEGLLLMNNETITPEERFATLVGELLSYPGVTPPADGSQAKKGFGSSGLKVHDKIFAMLTSGRLIVKLPKARVDELVASGDGERFDPRKNGHVMKEWLVLEPTSQIEWLALACEALEFVSAQR